MSRRLAATAALGAALAAAPVAALPTRSSPLAVAPDGHVFVVNPDSSSVARLDFGAPPGRLTHERTVGRYPRTLALDATHVFTAGQKDDTLWRLDQADLGSPRGPWPNARAIAVASDGGTAYVTHYLSEEPDNHAHVSVVDLTNPSVARVFAVAPDTTTCETQNSGQGPRSRSPGRPAYPSVGAPLDFTTGVLTLAGTDPWSARPAGSGTTRAASR